MRELKKRIQVVLSYALTLLLIGGYPAATFAETADMATVSPTSVAEAPATEPVYTYDATTNRWNTDKWQYDATSGQYGPVTQPGPIAPTGPTSPTGAGGGDSAPNTSTPETTTTTTPSVLDDTSSVTAMIDADSNTGIITNNTINNTVGSLAESGSADVLSNTSAGDATSGDASAAETIMNTINSSVAGGIASFVSNISGDVHGDILLYPMILGAMLVQAALNPTAALQSTTDVSVNADLTTNNQLTNNIDLNATSGSATVAGNTNAGDATSGSANAVANIMNVINSIIGANQSFIGTINIYGNLDGDILIAPDFAAQLLGSNGSSTVNQTTNASLAVNATDTTSILNNIDLSANSGSATVAGNTSAGDATSGSAGTNVVILNLTGHEIVASNSLLVFVNVLGQWIGMIVDAPVGSTAAAIGSGVDQNTIVNLDGTLSSQTNTQITNNITLASQSGDATVAKNTNAGNATSGNATASANILNMTQSSLDLSGWFGVLFINVFGSWLGSFGIDTEHGNQLTTSGSSAGTSAAVQSPQAVRFIAKTPTATVASQQSNLLAVSTIDTDSTLPLTAQIQALSSVEPTSSSTSATRTPAPGYDTTVTPIVAMGAVLILAASIRSLWPLIHRRFDGLVS